MSAPGMLFANFNQDYSCVSVGTRKGYSITNCDPFGRVYTQSDGARGIVEMLFATSLLALVGAPDTPSSSPRKLQIVNTKRQSLICELLFPASILAVKLNRKTLAIVLETEIYVYDISNMRLLHVIETVPNPDGICALSPSADAPYLAYPAPLPSPALTAPASATTSTTTKSGNSSSSSTTTSSTLNATASASGTGSGDVMLFSTRSLAPANVVRAHHSPLALLSLSADGSMLATASVKGTVIRIFSVPSLDKLYQFRRGTREARIHSLAFNGAGTLLAAASERGTVHLWRLGAGMPGGSGNNRGSSSSGSSNGGSGTGAESPAESTDGHTLDAGYDAFVAGKRRSWSGDGRGTMSAALRRSTGALAKFLPVPTAISEMWEPARDFAWARVPPPAAVGGGSLERRCVVGLSSTTPHLFVIASDGYFYAYSVDLERGGECVLVKQYSLIESGEESGM
ncbi:WD40 repeat-like protein [Roridomyces roridus]|uniref:WD40 repeat-like protein n=1 Tax=Roridomyces roridus TaxID=1738132 RepID=A0AAD7CGV5_9AGAR|nr:WD40 repeat-like protein [Roridomyces roridus]